MTFIKGQSGNPTGRPPKPRQLTTLLEAAGQQVVEGAEGKRLARKRLVAGLVWELVSTGQVTLPDGRVLTADLVDWLTAVKWIYAQIDGPPKAELALTGKDGAPLIPDPPPPLTLDELRQMVGVLAAAGVLDAPPDAER